MNENNPDIKTELTGRGGRWLIGLLVCGALVFAAIPMLRAALREMPWALRHLSGGWLLLCIAAQGGVYLCLTEILAVSLAALGHRSVPRITLLPTGAAFLLANRAIPGPAVAGLAVLVHRLKQRGVPAEAGQAVAAAFYGADYAGFLLLAFLALPFLAASHRLGPLHPRLLLFAVGIIVLCAVLLVLGFRSPGLLENAAGKVGGGLASLCRKQQHRDEWTQKAKAFAGAFRARAAALARDPIRMIFLCFWALLMHLCEAATLVLAARAFGSSVDFSVAAAGYIAGNLGAIVSFLPGGVGLYEGGMIAALHTIGGLRSPVAVAATLLYRLLTFWLPLPFALTAVRNTKNKKIN